MPAPQHYFLDLEGTIVKDKDYRPVDGAVRWVNRVKEIGKTVLIASNNTTDSAGEIQCRLQEAGFVIREREVLTCVRVGTEILRDWGAESCLVIGEASLREMLEEAGFRTGGDERFDAVVVGLDRSVTYGQLSAAVEVLLSQEIPLLALHCNRLYLDVGGLRGPSVGAIVRSLEYACNLSAVVAGKPSGRFYDAALRATGAQPGDVLFISDDPFSDLVGAKRRGMQTAFVLSGKYASDHVLRSIEPALKPDFTVSSVAEIEVRA